MLIGEIKCSVGCEQDYSRICIMLVPLNGCGASNWLKHFLEIHAALLILLSDFQQTTVVKWDSSKAPVPDCHVARRFTKKSSLWEFSLFALVTWVAQLCRIDSGVLRYFIRSTVTVILMHTQHYVRVVSLAAGNSAHHTSSNIIMAQVQARHGDRKELWTLTGGLLLGAWWSMLCQVKVPVIRCSVQCV